MNLRDMRLALRTDIFDLKGIVYTDPQIDLFLNRAMMHVANWADAQKQALFELYATATLGVGTGVVPWYGQQPDAFGIIPSRNAFRRFLQVQWRNGAKWTNIREVDQVDLGGFDYGDEVVVSVMSEGLRYINGSNKAISMNFVYSLAFMVIPTDRPGEVNGEGVFNALPREYHPLLVAWADVLALASMNLDISAQVQVYGVLQEDLRLTLRTRRSGKTGGVSQ